MRSTTKYLVVALWCTYEFLSVAVTRTLYLATGEYFGLSPLTLLFVIPDVFGYSQWWLLSIITSLYFVSLIIGFGLGWLFFFSEKIRNQNTRTVVMILFLCLVVCFAGFIY